MSNNIFKTGLNIPKKVQKLDLKNYHSDLKGAVIYVWVNLTRSAYEAYNSFQVKLGDYADTHVRLIEELADKLEKGKKGKQPKKNLDALREEYQAFHDDNNVAFEKLNDEIHEWYSMIWSQHENTVHHCTAEEVKKIAEASAEENDSDFWKFLTQTSQAMIVDYRNRFSKN